MHHVFISYSRADSAWIDEALPELQAAGIDTWIDRRDIPVSVPWLDEVTEAIEGADLVVFLTSEAWLLSQQCHAERTIATERGKTAVHVDVGRHEPHELAGLVRRALAGVKDAARLRTELLVEAATWRRKGRKRADLVRGSQHRALRRAANEQDAVVPPEARAFLAASRRRERQLRVLGWSGVAALIVAALAAIGLEAVSSKQRANYRNTNRSLQAYIESDRIVDADVYAGLTQASAILASQEFANLTAEIMLDALSSPVPDIAQKIGGAAVQAFVGTPSGRRALVRTTHGEVFEVTEDGHRRRRPSRPAAARAATLVAEPQPGSGVIMVRRRANGRVVRRVAALSEPSATALSPDERMLAAASGHEVSLIDLSTGEVRASLRGSTGPISKLAWTADGTRVWAVVDHRSVRSWPWHQGRVLLNERGAFFVGVSRPDAHGRVAVASRAGEVILVDTRSGDVVSRGAITDGKVIGNARSPDGEVMALGVPDKVVLYDIATGRKRAVTVPNCYPLDLEYADDGRLLGACVDGPIVVIDPQAAKETGRIKVRGAGSVSVEALPSGEILVGHSNFGLWTVAPGTDSAEIYRFILSGTDEETYGELGSTGYALATSTDGRWIAMGGEGIGGSYTSFIGHMRPSPKWYMPMLGATSASESRAIAISPKGRILVIGKSNGEISAMSLPDLDPSSRWTEVIGSVRGIEFTPDERQIFVATDKGLLYALPTCFECGADPTSFIDEARRRLRRAQELGLAPSDLRINPYRSPDP